VINDHSDPFNVLEQMKMHGKLSTSMVQRNKVILVFEQEADMRFIALFLQSSIVK